MAAEGLPYGERKMTYNSRLAQELGKWAETQPGGEAIHDALFRAYFVPGDKAREVIETRSFEAAVDEDWDKSRRYGVTGVPTFVIGDKGVVGAQPYEVLEQLVEQTK